MMFGWCILLVSAVSVKRINSAGIQVFTYACVMAAVATNSFVVIPPFRWVVIFILRAQPNP